MKVGDKTWFVDLDENDNPKFFSRTIVSVGPKRIRTEGLGGPRTHCKHVNPTVEPGWLPKLVLTKREALDSYMAQRQNEIARAKRKIVEIERLLDLAQRMEY